MFVTPSEYAALRRVSPAAVSKAVKQGRLRNSITRGKGGRVEKIDVIEANKEWEQNTDTSKVRYLNRQPIESPLPAIVSPPPTNLELPLPEGPSAADARYSRHSHDHYKAKLAKLEYEQRSGKLVDADSVRSEAFKLARGLRDSLMNIPDRLATEIAAMTDSHAVHRRITEEIRTALGMLTNA